MKLKHYEAGKEIKPIPWLVPEAIEFLRLKIVRIYERGTDHVPRILETGCGGSTLFFAELLCEITSFEHSKKWYDVINEKLDELNDDEFEKYNRNIIDLRFDPGYPKRGLSRLKRDYFDFALIDGRGRVKSIATAVQSVRDGGFLILDNAERSRYKVAVKMLNNAFKERIVFQKDWTMTFWKVQNK